MYFRVLDKPFHRRLLPVTFAMEEHVKNLELESRPAVKEEQAMWSFKLVRVVFTILLFTIGQSNVLVSLFGQVLQLYIFVV